MCVGESYPMNPIAMTVYHDLIRKELFYFGADRFRPTFLVFLVRGLRSGEGADIQREL
jgi:hypothetical protein